MNRDFFNKLKRSTLLNQGYHIIIDRDRNLNFVKEENEKILSISVPYSRKDGTLYSASSSIIFTKIQKLFTDLCFKAIKGNLNFIPDSKWLSEQYKNATVSTGVKVQSPKGIIYSEFKDYSLKDYLNAELDECQEVDLYKDYLDHYLRVSAEPFFTGIPDVVCLDKLTDNKDNYHLALYLNGIPPLKKIVLMYVVGNPQKEEALQKYKNQLSSIPSNNSIEAILYSINQVESYFSKEV
ncbi:MAG: hypothetical protein M9911_05415 [Saprospiraceae bacterium]|nr:hypothetical protein [Saprospiraceae bacterium]